MSTRVPKSNNCRTILVPIDCFGVARASLERLAWIAKTLNSTVLGLLLDNPHHQRIAELSFVTEIGLDGGWERRLLKSYLAQYQDSTISGTSKLLHELMEYGQISLMLEHAAGYRLRTALEHRGCTDVFIPARGKSNFFALKRTRSVPVIKNLGVLLIGDENDQQVLATTQALLQSDMVGSTYLLPNSLIDPGIISDLNPAHGRLFIHPKFKHTPEAIIRLINQGAYNQLVLPVQCLEEIPMEKLDHAIENSSGDILIIK